MAIFCLATDLQDLQRRLGNIIVGQTRDRKAVTAAQLQAAGSMTALLKDALAPNLVQTLENNPAFIHGGPFANIAHGCNSVIATKTALKLADYVVTEAGFGADLGAEKFLDIKCRKAGLSPDCVVLVATIRALKMHGGVAKDALKKEDLAALKKGFANLARHIKNIKGFGLPAVVSINRFSADTEAEIALTKELCAAEGVEAVLADHWADGGAGAAELARTVVKTIDTQKADFKFLYPDEMKLLDKVRTIAQKLYGAKDIAADKSVRDRLAEFEANGLRPSPGLHRQDAVQLLDRRQRQGRAERPHHPGPRGAPLRRRRVRRRDLRRDHDHAGPASSPRRQQHRRQRRGADHRTVLGPETAHFFYSLSRLRERAGVRATWPAPLFCDIGVSEIALTLPSPASGRGFQGSFAARDSRRCVGRPS